MAFIKLLLVFYLFILCCGAFGSFIVFVVDIIKFKDKEEKIKIIPSKESEVKEDERAPRDSADDDSGSEREHNSSAVFDSWLQS